MEQPSVSDNQESTIQTDVPISPILTQKSKLPLILAGILVVVFVGFAGFLLGQKLSQPKTPPQVQIAPTPPIPTPTPDLYTEQSRSATANWKTYQLSQLNMEFNMPISLNPSETLDFKTSHNDLYWNDSLDTPIRFSATSVKSTFEGGFSYLNGSVGYKKSGVGYKFLTYTKAEVDMPSQLTKEITNQNQIRYLIVNSDPNQTIDGMPPLGITEKGHIAAIINTNNADYPALVIQMKLTNTNDENIFNLILSTFKFLD